jgi:hypothetical protein
LWGATFNQEVIVESLGTHLSALEKILAWTLLVAIPVAWAGIRREEVIKAGFLEIQRMYAFYAVATLFLVVNVAILLLFLRVAGLLARRVAGLPSPSRSAGLGVPSIYVLELVCPSVGD